MRIANGEHFGGVRRFTDQIEHCGRTDRESRAKRQANHSAQMILELACECALDRPVARIVNAGRHFVGEQLAVLFEELDGENANILKFVENSASGLLGRALNRRIEMRSRRER